MNVTWTLAPRVALVGFAGYFINRPDVVYRDRNGSEFRNRWKADSVVLSVGMVYSIFWVFFLDLNIQTRDLEFFEVCLNIFPRPAG